MGTSDAVVYRSRMTSQSDVRPLRRVLLRHAKDAFVSRDRVAEQWRELNYTAEPDFDEACREYDTFASLLEELGTSVDWLSGGDLGLDSMYVRDASIVVDAGVVLCRMGKGARRHEPAAQGAAFPGLGFGVLGEIEPPGSVEGGDTTWLDEGTLAVGRGYRTSDAGIDQLAALLPDVDVLRVPLPHWRGPGDVFHLMSVLSPLGSDLLLVYSPLLTVPFREELLARGFELVEVPDEEFESQGCNVLAVAPRVAVALEGNPETCRRMEKAGVEVHTFSGREISLKGCGGPTCLTRPLERE
jgi:N-dimethylarginine dimethylaminohydrolase